MVAKAAYPVPLQAPTQAFPFTDDKGLLTALGMTTLQDLWLSLNGANLIIPCTINQTSPNILALTPLITSPTPVQRISTQVNTYTVFSTWAFVAAATTTGLVTASVSPLGALKVYKQNGAAQATTGDVVNGYQYLLTYVDSLNAGAGGLVIR